MDPAVGRIQGQDHLLAPRAGPAVPQVAGDRLARLDGQRESVPAAALAAHRDLARPPVDVAQLQGGGFTQNWTASLPSSTRPATGPPESGRHLQLPAGPMPCCGWSWRKLEYSMINCVPWLPSCAPWQAQAYGPIVSQLPSGTAKKWSPCTSSSTRPSLPLCRLCTKPAPGWQISKG